MKLSKMQTAIILPLKESFTRENSGAVSVWVNYYLKYWIISFIILSNF